MGDHTGTGVWITPLDVTEAGLASDSQTSLADPVVAHRVLLAGVTGITGFTINKGLVDASPSLTAVYGAWVVVVTG